MYKDNGKMSSSDTCDLIEKPDEEDWEDHFCGANPDNWFEETIKSARKKNTNSPGTAVAGRARAAVLDVHAPPRGPGALHRH